MYTPPQDDETMDQSPRQRTGPRYRPARSYTSSRSYSYSDEHPEVPKVKRASLGLGEADGKGTRDPQDAPRQSSTEKVARVERMQPRSSSARGVRPAPSARTRENRSERPSPHPASYHHKAPRPRIYDEDLLDTFEEHTGHTEAAPRTATKIMVAHRRHSTISTVYEPPSGPSAYRSQKRRPPKQRATFWTFLQRASHNRRLMVVVSVFIILLLVAPMIVNTIVNNNHSMTLFLGNNSSASSAAQSVTGGSTSNPHSLTITPANTTHPAPPVFATSAYLLDADTGATLYAHNPFMHLPMLSTTKLMTALLAAEKGNPEQKITINNAISNDINQLAADSSVMGMKKGETYTLRELLYGMFLMSGNDAATAVGDAIGGNLPTFVSMMNQRAAQLGLHDTHYMNPHGLLEDGHYSSAHDLAILGKTVMNIPLLHQISGTKQYTLAKTAQHAEHVMFNGNQFLWWYPGVDGGKPGWDGGGNFIQVVSVTRNRHHLIGVTMHTTDWWTDMRDLMNWGFNSFQWVSPHDSDLVSPIPYDSDWNYFARDTKTLTVPTADAGRYYVYSGYSISGIMLNYFDKNGGLQKFGYPESAPNASETTLVSQRFDRGTLQCDTANKQCKLV